MKARIGGREVDLSIDDRLQRSTDARRTTAISGSSGEAAIQETKTRRGESGAVASPQYDSKLEAAWAQRLALDQRAGLIQGWIHHPFSFNLADGVRYTVDFITWGEEGTVCYETKGWHKNMRDSLTRLKWAAQRFPFLKWRKVVREKGQWQSMDIVV